MKDPMEFVEKLQRGEDLGIPESQVIAEVSFSVTRIFGWVTIVNKSHYCAPMCICHPLYRCGLNEIISLVLLQ
jgi:hypothetical protein